MKLFSRDFFRFSSPAAREWRGISAFDLVAVESPAPPFPLSKAGLCLLVVFLWLAVGVFGRDPWKPDELLLSGFLARPGALSVAPSLWGEFAIGAGPLSIWMAAAAARFLPFAPLESALFAQAILLAAGFLGIGIAGARRLDLRAGFLAVLLCAGAVGFLARGHWLSGGAAGFAGMAWLLAGLAILPRASLAGGATTGSALGFLFLAAGPFECAAGAAAIVAAYCKRPKSPARVWPGAAATAVFALPWLVIWPALAAAQNPEWFARWMEWQAEQARGLASPAALAANVGEYVKLVAWAAFPLWILAAAAGFAKLRPTAGRRRRRDRMGGLDGVDRHKRGVDCARRRRDRIVRGLAGACFAGGGLSLAKIGRGGAGLVRLAGRRHFVYRRAMVVVCGQGLGRARPARALGRRMDGGRLDCAVFLGYRGGGDGGFFVGFGDIEIRPFERTRAV